MKRGELSMEVIIVAAIALLVLVILSVLLLNKGKDVNTGTGCQSPSIGGICMDAGGQCDEGYVPGSNTCAKGQFCCVPLNPTS
jgi:hypothetical protein